MAAIKTMRFLVAALFWKAAMGGVAGKIQLFGRSEYTNQSSNASTSSFDSSTITSAASLPTSSYNLMTCSQSPQVGSYILDNCYRPGNPDAGFDFRSPYNTTLYPWNVIPPDPSLASYCAALFTSTLSHWLATAEIVTYTGDNVFYAYMNSIPGGTGSVSIPGQFTWTAPGAPCCLNCTVFGGQVQIMVWPTPAPTPPISTLINADNYTFVSPSIYAVFQSLGATDLCGQKGSIYLNKTLAFNPTELSTGTYMWASSGDLMNGPACSEVGDIWQSFNYKDVEMNNCGESTISWWSYDTTNDTTKYYSAADVPQPSAIPGNEDDPQYPDIFTCTYNPCSPYISIPSQIYSVDSAFSGCVPGIQAFIDPPYFLAPNGGLRPFSATSSSSSSSSSSSINDAAPGAAGGPTIPTKTSTTTSSSSSSTKQSDPPLDPAQGDPSQGNSKQAGPSKDPPTLSTTSSSREPPADPPNSSKDPPTLSTTSSSSGLPADPPSSSKDPPTLPTSSSSSEPPADPPGPQSPTSQTDPPAKQSPTATTAAPASPLTHTDAPKTSTNAPILATFAGQVFSQDSASNYVAGTHTMTPGGPPVTMGGTTYSLATSGDSAVVDGTTVAVAADPQLSFSTDPIGKTYPMVGTQVITPGAPAVTISGVVYSMASSGSAIVMDGTTSTLSTPASLVLSISTDSSGSSYAMIGTQPLTPGASAVVLGGVTYSAASSGWAIAVDGTTNYLLGSQTLVAGGPALTVSGTVLSLQAGGASVIVEGSTQAISSFLLGQSSTLSGPTSTTSAGIGGIIASLGGFATPTSTSTATPAAYSGSVAGENGTTYFNVASRSQTDLFLTGFVLGVAVFIAVIL